MGIKRKKIKKKKRNKNKYIIYLFIDLFNLIKLNIK